MAKSAMTHARVSPKVKEEAEAILNELGIPISSAFEMSYLQIIANRGLPFDVRIPTVKTVNAMRAAREGKGKRYGSVDEMFQDCGV